MLYVEAPSPVPLDAPLPRIFLAGTITGAENWQKKVAAALGDLDCTVINPRRENFPMGDKEAGKEQIAWEFDKLWSVCDIFTMWMTKDTVGPICLYELGAALARRKVSVDNLLASPFVAMIVGCEPEYSRKFDVEVQAELVFGCPAPLHTTLDEHISMIRSAVEMFHECHSDSFPEDYEDDSDEATFPEDPEIEPEEYDSDSDEQDEYPEEEDKPEEMEGGGEEEEE